LLSQIESLTPLEVAISTLLLQHASFFAFGGSNAVSSVDLSSAYNGIGTYDPFPVGILTFTGNWAGSIWWAVAGVILLQSQRGHGREPGLWKGHVAVLTLFVAGSVAAVMAACTALRTHLFIWTVFSPKYLYCVAWSLGQHLLVNVGIGGLVYSLGVWERQRK
jgi:ethanolaminephosphotransferase